MNNCPVLMKDKMVREQKLKEGAKIVQYSED